MNMRIAAPALAAGALFAMLTGVTTWAADSKDAPPPPVATEPQTTSASYGDWILNCVRSQDGARVCEIVQSFQIQGQQGPFARLAIGHAGTKEPLRATFDVAPNISFPSTVKLGLDDKDTQPVELSWKKCVPGAGCFADGEIKDDILKRWKAQTGNGRITMKDSTGHDVAVPFSFRGLPQALDGLAKS
jgi:invasion protein IalB